MLGKRITGQIRARAEAGALAGDDHDPRAVTLGLFDAATHRKAQLGVQRVPSIRPLQFDGDDVAVTRKSDHDSRGYPPVRESTVRGLIYWSA